MGDELTLERDHETAMLIVQQGSEVGRRWPLQRKEVTIGREGSDITLPDRGVSRRHARITWDGQHYRLEDLGSKNGTLINGRELSASHLLEDGDEIQIALRFKLAFVDDGVTAPLTFDNRSNALRVDKAARRVWVRGREMIPPPSPPQFRFLEVLLDNEGRVVERDMVVRTVWPEGEEQWVSEQALDALVRRVRERLAEIDPQHQYVQTVRGHGYKLVNV